MTDTTAPDVPPSEPSTAPNVVPPPPLPPHNAGWAVVSLLFFWPLSFAAFTHSFNVYPLWATGDFAGAHHASERVRRLGQLSLWIFGGLLLLALIVYTIVGVILVTQGGDWGDHRRDYALAALRLATTT
jgi:Interferon-induced transmembrane protein